MVPVPGDFSATAHYFVSVSLAWLISSGIGSAIGLNVEDVILNIRSC